MFGKHWSNVSLWPTRCKSLQSAAATSSKEQRVVGRVWETKCRKWRCWSRLFQLTRPLSVPLLDAGRTQGRTVSTDFPGLLGGPSQSWAPMEECRAALPPQAMTSRWSWGGSALESFMVRQNKTNTPKTGKNLKKTPHIAFVRRKMVEQ